jgi:hypothetical protein
MVKNRDLNKRKIPIATIDKRLEKFVEEACFKIR